MRDNEKTKYQNLWDKAKAMLKNKIIALKAQTGKEEKFKINNLSFHLKKIE